MDRGTDRGVMCQRYLSKCLGVCLCMRERECVYECVQVWKLRPGTSLAGELMKTSVLHMGQISTSVMLVVVADSQTIRVLLPPPPRNPKVR